MGKYTVSPVAYEETGEERAYEPTEFKTQSEAEEFIADMGSRWCLYPNIEIYHRPNIIKRLFGRRELEFVVGYDEGGEYQKYAQKGKELKGG